MRPSDYSLAWILPFVRESLRGRGNFSYDNFVWGLWPVLERSGVSGIVKTPPERMFSNQPYVYEQAPYEVKRATTEAFYHLFHNGFIIPQPPQTLPGSPSEVTYHLTPRGLEWAASIAPLPEDVDGYMSLLAGCGKTRVESENSLVSTVRTDKKKACAEKTSNSWTCSATSAPSREFRRTIRCVRCVP